jgi:methyl-accepting chemotaxis protein
MAGKVIVKDVAAVEKFAGQLSNAKQKMEDVSRQLTAASNSVSGSWQDPQKDKCVAEIQQIVKAMQSFSKSADEQIRYCKKLASQLRSLG